MTNFYKNPGHQKYAFAAVLLITTLTQGTALALTTDAEPAPSVLESIVQTVTGGMDEIIPTEDDYKAEEIEKCANKIDNFFASHNAKITGMGTIFAQAAYANDEDCDHAAWVAALTLTESSLCTRMTKGSNNCWGWGGKKLVKFESIPAGIEKITAHLAGNVESTKKYYSKTKSLEQKILTYTPASDNNKNLGNVKRTIKKIQSMPDTPPDTLQLASN